MGLVTILSGQFQNATLARYPDAARQLGTFAIAASIFAVAHSALIFVSQMANVYNRSAHGARVCFRFLLMVCILLTVPLLFLGFVPAGHQLLAAIFDLNAPATADVVLYLKIVSPLILLKGIWMYWTGLLIQAHCTLTVSLLNGLYLAITIVMLLIGLRANWHPVVTVGVAQCAAALCHTTLSGVMVRLKYRLPEIPEHTNLTYRETFMFFWPLALNSLMFAMSRPVIFAFVSRTPNPDNTLAALRVAFEFSLLFFNPINQFRHLYVTFGREDPEGIKRFMIHIMLLILVLMLLLALTPIGAFVFGTLLGVSHEVQVLARQTTLVLCTVPLAMTLRNYFHGLSLVHRRTGRMGIGGVLRIIVVYVLCWGLQAAGWLDNTTAAAVLAVGFLIEALTMMAYNRFQPVERRA